MKKLSFNINLETCRFQHQNPTPIPRAFLRHKLEATGLNTSPIAKQIGYQNLNKGCRRIQEWVTREQVPSSSQGELFLQALGVTRAELNKENQHYQRQTAYQTLYRANNFEYEMLAKHVDVLMDNVDAICNSAQWKQIHLPYVGIFAMYVNLESIRLGQLLHAWNNNSMRLDEYHVVKVVGSPLSGSHSAYGFHRNDHTTWKNIGRIFERFGDGIKLFSKQDKDVSYWSFGQLLVELGIDLAPTTLYQKRTAVGQYDYASKRLTLLNETYDLTNCFANPNEDVEFSRNTHLRNVTLYKQNLQTPQGILCHWDQDLPPIVAERVARLLWILD
jgi:hypothetical protein